MDILSSLRTGMMIAVCGPHAACEPAAALAAGLALRGPVTVLDGGNRFQPYRVAQLIRQQTAQVDSASRRVFIRRAFTCYQMLALLEGTPALRQPFIILDLLGGFYDEHVSEREAHRLVQACLVQVERLCLAAPVVVTLGSPPGRAGERAGLLELVCGRAQRVLVWQTPAPTSRQLALFGGQS